jgi:hypothetical protein
VFSWVKCSWPHAEFGTRETEFESPHPHVLVARHNATMANLKREYIDGEGWKTVVDAGGGSQPVTREQTLGVAVTIAGGDGGILDWSSAAVVGTALLDVTDPTTPLVVEGGVYAISVQVIPADDLTIGANYRLRVDLDNNGEDGLAIADSSPATADQRRPRLVVSLTYYVPAGGVLQAVLTNMDGVVSHGFLIALAIIQRLSGPE